MKRTSLLLIGMILSANASLAALKSRTEEARKPYAALLVYDQTAQATCYLKDTALSRDLKGAVAADEAQQTKAESILSQVFQSDAVITECSGQTAALARELADGIQTGKQTALGPAALFAGMAYYAACTAVNAVHLTESMTSVMNFSPTPWTWSGVLSATV